MTYVPPWARFIFLAIVLDVWSQRVVGWAIGEQMSADLVLAALNIALQQRKPDDVIHHSDQGSQPRFNWSSQHWEPIKASTFLARVPKKIGYISAGFCLPVFFFFELPAGAAGGPPVEPCTLGSTPLLPLRWGIAELLPR